MLRKLFRPTVTVRWNIIEKETVDEIIFRTTNGRNRVIFELMARGGMRIGEVIEPRSINIQDRKLIIKDPKGGKEEEVLFIPPKVADQLWEYARQLSHVTKRSLIISLSPAIYASPAVYARSAVHSSSPILSGSSFFNVPRIRCYTSFICLSPIDISVNVTVCLN